MKNLTTLIAVWIIIGLATVAQANQTDPTSDQSSSNVDTLISQQDIDEKIINLPWEYELKDYPLELSNSSLSLSKGYTLVRGEAARRYDSLVQGTPEDPNTEAIIVNHDTETQMIFNFYEDGYVALENWEELDADELLRQISESTEQSNAGRNDQNFTYLKIGNWIQKPTLNQENHSVSWVFEVVDGDEKAVNAITIKLGRKGFEKIIWIGSYDNYMKSTDEMMLQVGRHTFNPGHQYADYSVGDKMAGLGIAGLVALTASGNSQTKAGLAAIVAGIVAGGKKLYLLIILGLGAVGALFRKLLSGKNKKSAEMSGA